LLQQPGFYDTLTAQTRKLVDALQAAAQAHNEVFCADAIGGMFGLYFSATVPATFEDVNQSDRTRFNRFFHAMLNEGVYLAPSAFEAGFVSVTHTDEVIEMTHQAALRAFASLSA